VRARIAKVDRVRVDPAGVAFPATESPIDNDLTAAVERVAAAEEQETAVFGRALDGFHRQPLVSRAGIASYGFSPIDATLEQRRAIHGPDENVDAAALERGVHRLIALIRELAG
jgi:acetylornithine deacetylase/succinyl-diaminopimelate desuccinylase-like protein